MQRLAPGAFRLQAMAILIGTSGYVYPAWRRRFYPPDLPASRWLAYYAAHFSTVELNRPFYRLPTGEMFSAWRAAVPPGFVFAVKVSRFFTHMKRLKDPEVHLRLFLERARRLGPALGPLLFQLPPRFHADLGRLDGLLRALARQRLVRGVRAALEVRHASWLVPEVRERLRRANVALCLHDSARQPVEDVVTADFVYVRRHGLGRRRYNNYPEWRLREDAARIAAWTRRRLDVYVYFNNDERAYAVANARRLIELTGARR
ncbi:MAG TPA: DUF72 domain-containing protein, partial [Candidatus Binatia bacterium]|nr:DUF72 domain-containing protein [Candidatus Binatia bacterium]